MMTILKFILPFLSFFLLNCAAFNKTSAKLNTHSSGFTAYPAQKNEFHPSFDYKSYDYLKTDILKDTSVFHSWLTKGPLYSRKAADSLVLRLPAGGFIELSDRENDYTSMPDDLFSIDTLKIISLPDSTPLRFSSHVKREVISWSTQITSYQ